MSTDDANALYGTQGGGDPLAEFPPPPGGGDGTPRLLLVSPSFFGYEVVIAHALATHGYAVTLLDERPGNSVVTRGLVRVRPQLLRHAIQRHYASALEDLERKTFDRVLIVKGEVMPAWFLSAIRRANPRAQVTYYAYDTLHPTDNYFSFSSLVDVSLTFDNQDASEVPGFSYRPLFFSPEFTAGAAHGQRPHEISTVATVNPDRYHKVGLALEAASSADVHLYTPSKLYLRARSIVDSDYRTVPRHQVSTEKLSRADVARKFQESRIVVDVQKPGQHGLTMRTLEALATGASLLTWNSAVQNEPFYDPARIHVVRATTPAAVRAGIEDLRSRPLDGRSPDGDFENYSAVRWAHDVLSR